MLPAGRSAGGGFWHGRRVLVGRGGRSAGRIQDTLLLLNGFFQSFDLFLLLSDLLPQRDEFARR